MRLKAVALVLSMAALAAGAPALDVGIAAAGDATSSSGGVSAEKTREIVLRRGDRGPAVKRVQRRLRHDVDGAFGRSTERAVKRFQRRKGLEPDGKVGPATARAATAPLQPGERPPTPEGQLPRVLRLIAKCESGGDPTAVSRDGRYRGKYQFTRSTWRGLGGRGDPAEAPEREQDKRALKLYRREGVKPWGACGRKVT